LEASGSTMVGQNIPDGGKVVRASQLIRSVGQTSGGGGSPNGHSRFTSQDHRGAGSTCGAPVRRQPAHLPQVLPRHGSSSHLTCIVSAVARAPRSSARRMARSLPTWVLPDRDAGVRRRVRAPRSSARRIALSARRRSPMQWSGRSFADRHSRGSGSALPSWRYHLVGKTAHAGRRHWPGPRHEGSARGCPTTRCS
jgi:hypothetical protein